jgi:O-acetyl-ADP-ribose deacetylase (regulator of RNase III)
VIEVRIADPATVAVGALLRPVAADGSAVTPAMRRLELVAGAELAEQLARVGELPVGAAAITPGGALAAEFVVHISVRSRDEPVTPAGVRMGLINGLRRVREWAIDSVAVVPLGTGAGNLDAEEAAEVMVPVLVEHVEQDGPPSRIVIVVETEYEREAFERRLERR